MRKRPSISRPETVQAEVVSVATPAEPVEYRYLIPWLLLFAGSGCAALIYEIVWVQLLQRVIGSSAVLLGLLLAAYMGGLCLGSAAPPRILSARYHSVLVYAALELGIGALGIVALFGVPLIGRIYLAGAGTGLPGLVLRGAVAAVCLSPTLLMGGSLPTDPIHPWVKGAQWLPIYESDEKTVQTELATFFNVFPNATAGATF